MTDPLTPIALAQPDLGGNELRYVTDAVESGWISSIGKYITSFEAAFGAIAGTEHVVATSSGTTGLHLALTALGIGPGDEVIVPTLTYVATANAVKYTGATAVLADVLPGTLDIDPDEIELLVSPKTKAVISVHLYGIPADVEAIARACRKHGLFHVEDAAEAHGASVGGRPVGSFGDAGVFSFFGNKILTTGEGGAVATSSDSLAHLLRLYRGQGMDPSRRYWFPVVGFNYRLTNIQAAIGLAQVERFDTVLAARRQLASHYSKCLSGLSGQLETATARPGSASVPWLQNIYLRDASALRRDSVMTHLAAKGIESRPVFYPMHVLPTYTDTRPFPVADDWSARGISLPLHTAMTANDVERVCSTLAKALDMA